ncbi:hypothetical protein CAMRE0001_1092 [Campylobacter rectus RM3267]|uniref:Uncharacterized protein n=1 Tax=Campylobacter rectus RM3267 TaxID=553218 RepID=B9D5I1_CAMRE|nr:hypothetical protein CAMRE0001_1092 [Campylobacter rectus RM3267]
MAPYASGLVARINKFARVFGVFCSRILQILACLRELCLSRTNF